MGPIFKSAAAFISTAAKGFGSTIEDFCRRKAHKAIDDLNRSPVVQEEQRIWREFEELGRR